MDGPLDLNKKRVIPEVTYSVVENFGWDARDKKQRKLGTITQLQFLDLKAEEADKLAEKTARCPELMRIEMAQFPWPRSFSGRLLGGAVQLNAAKA